MDLQNNMAATTKKEKKFTKQTESDSGKWIMTKKDNSSSKHTSSRKHTHSKWPYKYLDPQWKLYDLDDRRHIRSDLLSKDKTA